MPAPPTSIQPECRQTGQPAAVADVAGDVRLDRRLGEREVVRAELGSALLAEERLHEQSRVPLRSASVIPSSTASPSTWWNIGVCVASGVSRR